MSVGTAPTSLYWLPPADDFEAQLDRVVKSEADGSQLLAGLRSLANRRLDFLQTRRLDRAMTAVRERLPGRTPSIRLAILASSTWDHILPAVRVGALRRGLLAEVWAAPFGQWRQCVLDRESELYGFAPDAVLFALDRSALLPDLPLATPADEVDEAIRGAVAELVDLWRVLKERTKAAIIQQTSWSDEPFLFGHFERQVPAAPRALSARFDCRLSDAATAEHVLLFDVRDLAAGVGVRQVSDPALWHHAKQAFTPAVAPWVGDHVARILAGIRGLSKKVLVLDLDNTLWGGTIGDDGLDGIVLGQGSGTGEAYVAFQRYVKALNARGIVLAVSSKNDLAVAEAPFSDHPEMVLRRQDFAAFEADWNDKPSAVRRIAEELELGLDSFVFFDDNPAERDLMRRTLPDVAVPEVPEAPELYARCLADAGYFEAVSFTAEDLQRAGQYAANRERRKLQASATDMESFLRDLQMTLTVGPFQPADLGRITQLINKTNQFNLTTRRYTEGEVRALMEDPAAMTFAARLTDRFGDNGLTSIVIGRVVPEGNKKMVELDSWLMSCRVLGRRVEHAMLCVVADEARAAGAHGLIGRYRKTAKNGMVKDFYPKLGFAPIPEQWSEDESAWILPLEGVDLPVTDHMTIVYRR